MISLKKSFDAIIIGGGPAGSSTAALLAEKGHDVLVVEKEKISPVSCWRVFNAILLLSFRAFRACRYFDGISKP